MGLSTSSSLSSPGSHAKRRGLKSPRFCSSSKFSFLRNGLRGQSADSPCGWADPSTPPPSDHAHLVITFSPIRLCHCRTQLHHRSSHPHQLPGSILSPLADLHHSIPQCETRNKYRCSPLCTERSVRCAPQHHPAPHQARGPCHLGETQTQGQENTSQRNSTAHSRRGAR